MKNTFANRFYTAVIIFTAALTRIPEASAQQMVIDDAAITTQRSFQLEAWYGSHESWIVPAVGINSWLELSAGTGFDSIEDNDLSYWTLVVKIVSHDLYSSGYAFSFVAGTIFDTDSELMRAYANLPFSIIISSNGSVIHTNFGGVMISREGNNNYSITYGLRGDFVMHENIIILSEILAVNRNFGFQAGFRLSPIPGFLSIDLTLGRGFKPGDSYPRIQYRLCTYASVLVVTSD